MSIPDAAVEAVARRNYESEWGDGWDGVIANIKRGWLKEARAQCEAAAPHLMAAATKLIADLSDPDDCWFDHHGGCQAHGYHDLGPGETCPQADAKQWVKAHATG